MVCHLLIMIFTVVTFTLELGAPGLRSWTLTHYYNIPSPRFLALAGSVLEALVFLTKCSNKTQTTLMITLLNIN